MRRVVALLLTAFVAAACTSSPAPEPTGSASSPTAGESTSTPTTDVVAGGSMAVVVSPDPPESAATAEVGVRVLATELASSGRLAPADELRVVTADDPSFVADVASYLAGEGYHLVCALGAGAADAVRRVAPAHPSTRFCAAPATPDRMPANVLPIDVRIEDVGRIAGAAAVAITPGAPVGLLTAATTYGRPRIEAGLREAIGDTVQVMSGTVPDAAAATERATTMYEAGVGLLLTLAGEADPGVLAAATAVSEARATASPTPSPSSSPGQPAPSPSPPPPAPMAIGGPLLRPAEDGAPLDDAVVAVIEVHLEVAARVAVDRFIDGWSTEPASVGAAEGAILVIPGDGPYAAQARDAILAARDALGPSATPSPSG